MLTRAEARGLFLAFPVPSRDGYMYNPMLWFILCTTTEYHRLSNLKKIEIYCLTVFEAGKSKIKSPVSGAGLLSRSQHGRKHRVMKEWGG